MPRLPPAPGDALKLPLSSHFVFEGEVESVRDDGTDRYRAGEVRWERPRVAHTVRNVSPRPARLLTIHFDPPR